MVTLPTGNANISIKGNKGCFAFRKVNYVNLYTTGSQISGTEVMSKLRDECHEENPGRRLREAVVLRHGQLTGSMQSWSTCGSQSPITQLSLSLPSPSLKPGPIFNTVIA